MLEQSDLINPNIKPLSKYYKSNQNTSPFPNDINNIKNENHMSMWDIIQTYKCSHKVIETQFKRDVK
jgi:hypothetical protein